MESKKKVLIAPLNWGLGHATRCIPIIRQLHDFGVEVILASDGRAYTLLSKEFPHLTLIELPAYNITYQRKNFVFGLMLQLPKMVLAVWKEYLLVQRLVKQHGIHGIISDNRFGCFSRKIPSVFITHQINLMVPNQFLQILARKGNIYWINTFFNICWVPDLDGEPNLSGELSHGMKMKSVAYLGVLSRMKYQKVSKKYDLIAVLSGPEPQRTYLEDTLLEQCKKISNSILVVAGKPETQAHTVQNNMEYVAFMTSEELNQAMLASDVVICRSGYSTLMDLVFLNKKAILIPTPGQTEQEYLAHHFEQQGIFVCQQQDTLDIEAALEQIQQRQDLDVVINKHAEIVRLNAILSNFYATL
jgi:uncharacterized protein (TIGR00661 family)